MRSTHLAGPCVHVEDAPGIGRPYEGALLHGDGAIELRVGDADSRRGGAGVGARGSAGGLAGIGIALGAFGVFTGRKFAREQVLPALGYLAGHDGLDAGRGRFAGGGGGETALILTFHAGLLDLRLHQCGGFGNREQLSGLHVVAAFDQQLGQYRATGGFGRDGGGDLQRPLPGFEPAKSRYLGDRL